MRTNAAIPVSELAELTAAALFTRRTYDEYERGVQDANRQRTEGRLL